MKKILRTKEMSKKAKYIAIDKNGVICGYSDKPKKRKNHWFAFNLNVFMCRINIKPYCKNWKKSLRKIVDVMPLTKKELHTEVLRLTNEVDGCNMAIKTYLAEIKKLINEVENK